MLVMMILKRQLEHNGFFHYRCLPFRPYEEGKRKRRSDDEQTLSEITAVRLHLK